MASGTRRAHRLQKVQVDKFKKWQSIEALLLRLLYNTVVTALYILYSMTNTECTDI